MAVSVATLTTHIANIMPKGYNTAIAPFTTWTTESIAETLAMAAPEFRERVWADCFGDGVTKRFPLPGFDVSILPINQWVYPHSLNSAGVANPTTAPTLALRTGGSTIPSGAIISVGFEWLVGTTETQMSPLVAITTTAANQTVDVTIPIAPLGVTTCHIFSTITITNTKNVGRVASTQTVSNTTTTVVTSLGLGAATVATLPLLDYVDPTTVGLDEGSVSDGVPDLEFNEDVTGRTLTDLTAAGVQTVIGTSSALTSGQRLRVWYLRTPQLPASSTTAILGVPDDFLYTGVAAFMHRYLALNHETGAKDQHWQAYLDLHNLLMTMKSTASARATNPARVLQWAAQTI